MPLRKFFKVTARKFEQGRGRAQALFLQMNECAGELNQALVEAIIRAVASLPEPKFLQHVMRFIEHLPIEAFEVTNIVRGQILTPALFDQCGDFWTLLAHSKRESFGV